MLAKVDIRTRGASHVPDRVVVSDGQGNNLDLSAFCFAVETRHEVSGVPSVVLHLHAGEIDIEHDPEGIFKGQEIGQDFDRDAWRAGEPQP